MTSSNIDLTGSPEPEMENRKSSEGDVNKGRRKSREGDVNKGHRKSSGEPIIRFLSHDRKFERPGGRVARVRIATATGRCGFESHLNRTFVEDCDWWNFFGLQLHPQRSSMATPSCLHGAASTMDALVLAILAFFVYGWLCSPSVCGFSLLLASL